LRYASIARSDAQECLGASALFAEKRRVSTPSTKPPRIHAITGWRRALLWPLGLLMRLWGLTLRLEATDAHRGALEKRDEPVAMVLWHNRLFLAAEFFRRFRKGRPAYALVSASNDGAWLSAFFSLVGMNTVRGSSSNYGREAVHALIEVLREGHDIGITPDGPRGPIYDFKPGSLIVTRRAVAPMLLLGFELEDCWRLRSWDRFCIPKPFARVRVRGELVPAVEQADRDAALDYARQRLLALNPEPETAGNEAVV
jgi:lysophospholipid acyltransferase (LPLAT)-like uncharacterized protein